MANAIINAILKFIMFLVNLLLTPISLLIKALIPDLSNALQMVADFFDYLKGYAPLVVSYSGLMQSTVSLIILLLIAIVSIPLAVHTFKLALNWYNTIKL